MTQKIVDIKQYATNLVRIPEGRDAMEELERQVILLTLRRCYFIQNDAAELLGISAGNMSFRIQKLGITISPEQKQKAKEILKQRRSQSS